MSSPDYRLSWDKCLPIAATCYAGFVAAFGGSYRLQPVGQPVTWPSAVLLVFSAAFLFVGLLFTLLTVLRHPRYSLGERYSRWRQRKKRLKGEQRYRVVRGSHSRNEEGEYKTYNKGDIIGFTPEAAEKHKDQIEGPLDEDEI